MIRLRLTTRVIAILVTPLIAGAAVGQSQTSTEREAEQIAPAPLPQQDGLRPTPGTIANSVVGQVGIRKNAAEVAGVTVPAQRIDGRIQNRVQSRIRNRIDRFYDPMANTRSPFVVASEQAKAAGAGRSSRR